MQKTVSEFSKTIKSTEAAKSVSQLIREWYGRAHLAKSRGRKVAWVMVGVPTELLVAFDIDAVWPENYGTACASKQMATHFMSIAEREGYPVDICSYARNGLGYACRCQELGTIPAESPHGGMAEPDMLLSANFMCDVRLKWFQTLATRFLDIPIHTFEIDAPPYGIDINNPGIKEHYIALYLDSLKDLVLFLEQETGKKLDEAKLSKALVNTQEIFQLMGKINNLRKAIPSPMPSEDEFACMILKEYMFGEKAAVDFYGRIYKELKNRVSNGIGVIADEKYRLLWIGIPPWFNMGLFNYLESLGAVSVMETTYYIGDPVEVDCSKPLEALAERTWLKAVELNKLGTEVVPENAVVQGGLGNVPLGLVSLFIEEYKIDGVILHTTMSCHAIAFGQRHVSYELTKLGVPCLLLESDMADPRAWSDIQIKAQVDDFIKVLSDRNETKARG
jgi:benzoyl-CoA reductase subunit B